MFRCGNNSSVKGGTLTNKIIKSEHHSLTCFKSLATIFSALFLCQACAKPKQFLRAYLRPYRILKGQTVTNCGLPLTTFTFTLKLKLSDNLNLLLRPYSTSNADAAFFYGILKKGEYIFLRGKLYHNSFIK